MSPQQFNAQLLVEGKNDRYVIWSLCQQHKIAKTFEVEIPGENGTGGVEALLKSLPVRLKIPNLTALGIVLDADQSLERRWQSVLDRLNAFGYIDLPAEPDFEGTIITCEGMPKVGIWIMPNNQIPGMLEDFVAFLIPENDQLAAKASTVLEEIEQSGLNKYSLNHHSKAFLHTWLAWQENPGQPMGQAITAHTLNCNAPLANLFVAWLNKLFVEK